MSFVRRTNGYLLAGERLKENKTRILDIGGTHFRVKNNGNNITIDNLDLHFDSKGNLTVFRATTNPITLHSLDELKKMVNRYRMMYKKALVFSKQLQIEEDFCE